MNKLIIIIAIVVVIGLYYLNKVKVAQQLEFKPGLPRNVSLRGGELSFDFPIIATNVTSGSVSVKSIDFDVIASGSYLGKARLLAPVSINPNGNTTLIAHVTVGYFDLISAAGSIWNVFRKGSIGLTLDGLIYAEGFQIPFKQDFPFTLPKL